MNFWDYSFWDSFIQFGFLLGIIVLANILRRKVGFLRKSLLPSALIAGIIALVLKSFHLVDFVSTNTLDMLTYHTICIGFIALSLKRTTKPTDKKKAFNEGLDSGATIVGTYLVQAIVGLLATLLLSMTLYPDLFAAGGILLPLGFGQGPGQANNFGTIYQALGFTGGKSFAMAVTSIGFLVGCIVGVIYVNIKRRKGLVVVNDDATGATVIAEEIAQEDEMPPSEPVDKLTMNAGIIALVFLFTCGFMYLVDSLLVANGLLGDFGTKTLRPLVFGFNFIFGSLFALLFKVIFNKLRKHEVAKHHYTNNALLNRISGFCFDIMILAGVMLIDITVLAELIVPLVIVCLLGTIATYAYLEFVCKRIYRDSPIENFLGFYGMLTGTASTGVALIRIIDPYFNTNASNNLVIGSTFAIVLGFPMMLLVSLAPTQPWLTLAIIVALGVLINMILFRRNIFKKRFA